MNYRPHSTDARNSLRKSRRFEIPRRNVPSIESPLVHRWFDERRRVGLGADATELAGMEELAALTDNMDLVAYMFDPSADWDLVDSGFRDSSEPRDGDQVVSLDNRRSDGEEREEEGGRDENGLETHGE